MLQVAIILLTAALLVAALRPLGQPAVVAEMAAGFVLGPIVLGALFPAWHAQLFAAADLEAVRGLGLVGVVLFMFVMGADFRLDTRGAGRQVRAAATLSVLSFTIPFALGLAIAPWLHAALSPPGLGFWPFALFLGTALSVTALPVMARILEERSLTHEPPGKLALSAAALGDAGAWLVLALIVAGGRPGAQWGELAQAAALLAAFCATLFGIVRPLLTRHFARRPFGDTLRARDLSLLLAGALASAWVTEQLQVHAAFGAFLFGLALPRDERLAGAIRERIGPLVALVLLPCFFALAGLATTGQAFTAAGPGYLALILAVAIGGKFVAGAAGSRLAGQSWRDALCVGALMNTRGVVELVFLQVGRDAGLIGPELFTMLFVTALVTTFMTGPILRLARHAAPLDSPSQPQRP